MENLNIFVLVFVVSGGILCALAIQVLRKQNLFKHMLVLLPCLMILGGGFVAILLGLDMLEYTDVPSNKPLATIYFNRKTGDHFSVRVKDYKGDEYSQELEGDYWQLDARVIRLSKNLPLKAGPLIRLEHFCVLNRLPNNTVNVERSVGTLHRAANKIDAWQWLKKVPRLNRLVSFEISRTMKKPLENKAVYTISLSTRGLIAENIPLTANSTNNNKRI